MFLSNLFKIELDIIKVLDTIYQINIYLCDNNINLVNITIVLSLIGILISISSLYKFSTRKVVEKIATIAIGGTLAGVGIRGANEVIDRVVQGGNNNQPSGSGNTPNNNPSGNTPNNNPSGNTSNNNPSGNSK